MDNKREEIGKIMLYACIGTSAIIVICNIIVLMLDDSEMAITTAAWLSTVFWSVIGWIPNIVADVLLRKCGKRLLAFKILSWVLYLLVGPTGVCNPIPQGV